MPVILHGVTTEECLSGMIIVALPDGRRFSANPRDVAESLMQRGKDPGLLAEVTVTILDSDLRADALRVAASRQVNQSGSWVDAPVQAATVQRLEDIILTKARELRREAVS